MKVLVLDSWGTGLSQVAPDDNDVHVEAEMFPFVDVYTPAAIVLEYIQTYASDYGLIIIGNNLGAGLLKAKFVPQDMRSRCVVVWNDEPAPATSAPYKAMGYKHFTSRQNLRVFLKEHPEIYRQ